MTGTPLSAVDAMYRQEDATNPTLVGLDTVQPEAVEWLWPSRIPLGKLTILQGDPGLGKSTMAIDIAARLTTGRPMPDDTDAGIQASVIFLSAEDGAADSAGKQQFGDFPLAHVSRGFQPVLPIPLAPVDGSARQPWLVVQHFRYDIALRVAGDHENPSPDRSVSVRVHSFEQTLHCATPLHNQLVTRRSKSPSNSDETSPA